VWARLEPAGVRVGFTHIPCSFLGDVVYVELPPPGTDVEAGEPVGLVESSTAVCEVVSPVSGVVAEVNSALEDSPERITAEPFGEGWLLVIRPSGTGATDALLGPEEYGEYAAKER